MPVTGFAEAVPLLITHVGVYTRRTCSQIQGLVVERNFISSALQQRVCSEIQFVGKKHNSFTFTESDVEVSVHPLEIRLRTAAQPCHQAHSCFDCIFVNIERRCMNATCNTLLQIHNTQSEKASGNYLGIVPKIFGTHS